MQESEKIKLFLSTLKSSSSAHLLFDLNIYQLLPLSSLKLWDLILGYLMRLSLQKAWFKAQKDDREQAMMLNGVSLLILLIYMKGHLPASKINLIGTNI